MMASTLLTMLMEMKSAMNVLGLPRASSSAMMQEHAKNTMLALKELMTLVSLVFAPLVQLQAISTGWTIIASTSARKDALLANLIMISVLTANLDMSGMMTGPVSHQLSVFLLQLWSFSLSESFSSSFPSWKWMPQLNDLPPIFIILFTKNIFFTHIHHNSSFSPLFSSFRLLSHVFSLLCCPADSCTGSQAQKKRENRWGRCLATGGWGICGKKGTDEIPELTKK